MGKKTANLSHRLRDPKKRREQNANSLNRDVEIERVEIVTGLAGDLDKGSACYSDV